MILRWLAAFAAATTPFALITVAALNYYYGPSALFWDSGYFAYHAAFSTEWPMWEPSLYYGIRLETFRRGGSGCLNRISALISGASAGVRLPCGEAAG